jgi:uncharacterized delta-60 repeat protein
MTVRHRALILVGVMAAAVLAAAPVVTAQAVTVTGVSPSSAAQGTTSLNVTISGKNFKAGATVALYRTGTKETGGVVVSPPTYKRATQLIANIQVPGYAAIGSYDVVVQVGASLGTGVALFRVTAKAIDPCASGAPEATADSSGFRDGTFGTAGVVVGPKFMEVAAVTTDAEDRIVAVGSSWDRCAGTAREWTIVRYLADGQPDLSFGSNGVATKKFERGDGTLYAVAIDGSGRIVVGGYRHLGSSANYGVVARYSADGTLDTTFAPDGLEPGIRSLSLERYMT